MEVQERQRSANQATDTAGKAPSTHDDVPDPEEDDLDDLDGMTELFSAIPSHMTYCARYAR